MNEQQIVSLFKEMRPQYYKLSHLDLVNFADPFAKYIYDLIESKISYHIKKEIKKSIIENSVLEIFKFLSKVLITESHIYKIENNLSEVDTFEFSKYVLNSDDKISELVKLYPFLFEFVLTRCEIIADSYVECISNTNNDISELKKNNLINKEEELCGIYRGQGDSHNFGRTVIELNFTETTIFYKPKNSNITEQLFKLEKWIEERSNLKFYYYKILNKQNYCYEEKVSHSYASNKKEVENFYFNFGVQIGLLHLFGSTDYHYENIIAHGEFPVLIDNETLFDPKTADYSMYTQFLVSGLLPNMNLKVDLSALTFLHQKQSLEMNHLTKENNEYIYKKNKVTINKAQNQPLHDIDFMHIYTNQKHNINRGLKAILAFFIENKEDLFKSDALNGFKDKDIRIILRDTSYYSQLLSTAFHPYHIKTKDSFKQFLLKSLNEKKEHALIKLEVNQLLYGDVPIFHMNTNHNYLKENSQEKPNNKSPFDILISKINKFKPVDIYASQRIFLKILEVYYKEGIKYD